MNGMAKDRIEGLNARRHLTQTSISCAGAAQLAETCPLRTDRHDEHPGATSTPPANAPIPLPCLLKDPRNTRRWRPGPPVRFTSKCRKMSQNVALFHTPTRRMTHFTSKKPHVFGQKPAILAHSRSFRSSSASSPVCGGGGRRVQTGKRGNTRPGTWVTAGPS